jgi:hypothetical protein
MPNFNLPSDACREMSARGCKCERGYLSFEGKDSPEYVRKDRVTVFIHREEEVSTRVQRQPGDVPSVRKWKGV